MTRVDIQQMSLAERLEAMESLWESLIRDAESLPSPEWHREVIDERMKRVKSGEESFLTIDEVRRKLQGE